MNGDGTECVGLEVEEEKYIIVKKFFLKLDLLILKDKELNEKFDAIACSYSISPKQKHTQDIIDHYTPICITINSDLKGIKGTRIGKHTIVSGKIFQIKLI